MRTIAVINQKGGVGKTTTAANLSHALTLEGQRTLAVDVDPQGHLAAHLGLFRPPGPGLANVLSNDGFDAEYVVRMRQNLELLPPGDALVDVERRTYSAEAERRFRAFVESMEDRVDFLVLDCPPASGVLIGYALTVAEELLIPVASDYLALRGLSDLLKMLRRHQKTNGVRFRRWVLLTRYHVRRRLSRAVHDKLIEYFPNEMLPTPIRELAVLAECSSFGKTAFEYRPGNPGARDYAEVARAIIAGGTGHE